MSRVDRAQPAAARRTARSLARPVWLAAAALLCHGCLFHDAPPPRYYTPPSALAADDPPATAAASGHAVRLRRVRAAGYIGEQCTWRASDVEHGLYEQRRWTDFPSRYLERAMDLALTRTPGLRRVDSGRASTLDLELVSFDEVVSPTHEADVQVVAVLRDARNEIVFQRTFGARQPIPDADPASSARAIGTALDDVVLQIAAQVSASVSS